MLQHAPVLTSRTGLAKIRKTPKLRDFMMHITASELNKRPGKYLQSALSQPVIVEKMNEPMIVMISYQRYQELEDAYWGELTLQAEKEPTLGIEKTKEFLNSIL